MNIMMSIVCTDCYEDDVVWLQKAEGEDNYYGLIDSINLSEQFKAKQAHPDSIYVKCKCGKEIEIGV